MRIRRRGSFQLGQTTKALRLPRLYTRSAQNATASVEPISVNTCSSRMVKIAALIGTTEGCPQVQKRPSVQAGALLPYKACSQRELLRKHAASHLRFSFDLGAESRCPVGGSSWKYPLEGCSADVCSGSCLSAKSYLSNPRYPLIRLAFAFPAPVCCGVSQFRYSYSLLVFELQ